MRLNETQIKKIIRKLINESNLQDVCPSLMYVNGSSIDGIEEYHKELICKHFPYADSEERGNMVVGGWNVEALGGIDSGVLQLDVAIPVKLSVIIDRNGTASMTIEGTGFGIREGEKLFSKRITNY